MPDSFKTRKIMNTILKLGFKPLRQKGSHLFLEHSDGRTTVIPQHNEIRIGLLEKIIKQDLKMKKEEFFKLLK